MLKRMSIRIAKIASLYVSICAWIIFAGIVVPPTYRWLKSGMASQLTEHFFGAPYPAHYLFIYIAPAAVAYGLTCVFWFFEKLEPPHAR